MRQSAHSDSVAIEFWCCSEGTHGRLPVEDLSVSGRWPPAAHAAHCQAASSISCILQGCQQSGEQRPRPPAAFSSGQRRPADQRQNCRLPAAWASTRRRPAERVSHPDSRPIYSIYRTSATGQARAAPPSPSPASNRRARRPPQTFRCTAITLFGRSRGSGAVHSSPCQARVSPTVRVPAAFCDARQRVAPALSTAAGHRGCSAPVLPSCCSLRTACTCKFLQPLARRY